MAISKRKVSIVNLIFNYANTFFLIINGLVLLPIYLKYFSLDTYGSYLSSGNIVGMLGLLDGGMSLVLTQKLAASFAKKDRNTFAKLLGAGLFISIILTVSLILIALALMPFISDWVKARDSEYVNIQNAFLLSAIGAGLSISFHNFSSIFQAWLKVHISGFANVISVIIGIVSTLIGLKLGLGVVSIPLGVFMKGLSGLVVLIIPLIVILKREKYPKITVDKISCVDLLKSCLPVLSGNISKSIIDNSQLLIITNFINPTSSAIFVLTSKIYQVCSMILAPIGSSIFSSISQLEGQGDYDKIKHTIIKVFTIFTLISALILSTGFALNSAFVSLWVGGDKFGGAVLSFLLCLNVFFNSRFAFMNFNLFALGVFGKTVLYDQISSVLRIVLIFALISRVGIIAVPISEFLSITFISGFFLNKLMVNKLGLNKKETVHFVSLGLLVTLFSFILALFWQYYFPNANSWPSLVFNTILFVMLSASILITFNKDNRLLFSSLISLVKKKIAF